MKDDEMVTAVADEVMRRLEGYFRPLSHEADAEFLTLAEVARRTAFSYDFVYDAVRKGELPAVQKGREWRVAVADMRAWMNKDRVGPVTPAPARSDLRAKVNRLMPGLKV